jgi:hypothetical protein
VLIVVKRQVEGGAAFDVVIVTRSLMDDLTKQDRIVPETRFDVGRAGAGVAVLCLPFRLSSRL